MDWADWVSNPALGRLGGAGELAAAGIAEPALRSAYLACRRLNATHGRTYFLATRLLSPAKRPYVHALYGFARYADELVDGWPPEPARFDAWAAAFLAGRADGPTLAAVQDTIQRWEIPREHFTAFLAAMRQDFTVTGYQTYDELLGYVHGSAAVIGRQLVPILEPLSAAAYPYAADLGIGFQLTNFIRDVGEDLRRGRVYLPAEDLAHFGVTREQLAAGVVDGRVRRLLGYQVARAREVLRRAHPGIRLLHPTSRPCIETAFRLYGGILEAVEQADYQVLDRRVTVSLPRRLMVAGPALLRARRARAAAGPTRPTSTGFG